MTQSSFSTTAKAAALGFAAALAFVPFLVSAESKKFVDGALTQAFKLGFSAKVTNDTSASAWKSALAVTPGTDITLKWDAGPTHPTKGCVANWGLSEVRTTHALSVQGTENGLMGDKNKTFIITCYGVGIAQTAKVQVAVTKPDLVVSVPRISSTSLGKGKYLAGPALIGVTVQNLSAVPVDKPFRVVVQYRKGAESFVELTGASVTLTASKSGYDATFVVSKLAPKEKKGLVHEGQTFGNEPWNTYFFRACVDEGAEVKPDGTNDKDDIDETSERNNCSSQTKAFIFADRI